MVSELLPLDALRTFAKKSLSTSSIRDSDSSPAPTPTHSFASPPPAAAASVAGGAAQAMPAPTKSSGEAPLSDRGIGGAPPKPYTPHAAPQTARKTALSFGGGSKRTPAECAGASRAGTGRSSSSLPLPLNTLSGLGVSERTVEAEVLRFAETGGEDRGRYIRACNQLVVTVLEARGLRGADHSGFSDP
jgi:hypothetical protein